MLGKCHHAGKALVRFLLECKKNQYQTLGKHNTQLGVLFLSQTETTIYFNAYFCAWAL